MRRARRRLQGNLRRLTLSLDPSRSLSLSSARGKGRVRVRVRPAPKPDPDPKPKPNPKPKPKPKPNPNQEVYGIRNLSHMTKAYPHIFPRYIPAVGIASLDVEKYTSI